MGKKIVLTGGGTAGHVTPNMALIQDCASLDMRSAIWVLTMELRRS